MKAEANDLVLALRGIPALSDVAPVDLTRMVPYLDQRSFQSGDVICRTGSSAENAFFVVRGTVSVRRSGRSESREGGLVGEEAAVGLDAYVSDVVADGPVMTVVLPSDVFREHQAGGVTAALYRSIAERMAGAHAEAVRATTVLEESVQKVPLLAVVGWLLAIAAPAAVLLTADRFGLDWSQRNVLAALFSCLVMWAFNLVPQYAAATIAVVGCLVLGAVPTEVILSGWGDEDLFMMFGVCAVGSVLVRSGITYRGVLNLIKRCPETPWGYNLAFLFAGLALTPALPSANTRVELLTPLTGEASRTLGFRPGSRETTRLLLSMFVGSTIFAPIFLTSKSLNFIVYGMLPDQISAQFHWLRWLSVTWPLALLMVVLYMGASAFLFRGGEQPRLSRTHVDAQLATLGPMRLAEWIALGSVAFFVLSLATYSFHKISPFWVSFGVFLAFLLVGILEKRNLERDFDWSIILMVGFFIGLTVSLDHVGITDMVAQSLSVVTDGMRSNFELSLLLLVGIIAVARIFLPITTCGVVLCSLLIPLSSASGVNPFVVIFVVLMLNECWVLPFQSSYFQTFEIVAGGPALYDRALFLKVNAMTIGIRLVTAFAAIQYMRMIDLL